MTAENLNLLWASVLVEELTRLGVRLFVTSPGSRNAPLVIAAARNDRAEVVVHADERGAAFFALGYGKATGSPAALISTSGTAAANYLPAVVEASQSRTPLLLLTADRPVELLETGAPQTVLQAGLFGRYVRWQFELPAPLPEIPVRFLLTTVDQAYYRSVHAPAGPVHLNCAFREPLAPEADGVDLQPALADLSAWRKSRKAFTRYAEPEPKEIAVPDEVAGLLRQSRNPAIVAGPLPAYRDKSGLLQLAQDWHVPFLADPASGLRFVPNRPRTLLSHYDLYLRGEAVQSRLQPDLVLHFGDPPTSKALAQFLRRTGTRVHIADHPFRQDPEHLGGVRVQAAEGAFASALRREFPGLASDRLQDWLAAEAAARRVVEEHAHGSGSELAAVHQVLQFLPHGAAVFLGNSMLIRDADGSGVQLSRDVLVGCNRGANGIDGTLATAAGFALGSRRPTAVLLGDIALFHDLNSLQFLRRSKIPLVAVVMQNGGGGIFSFLPISAHSDLVAPLFYTDQNLSVEQAARLFELPHAGTDSPEALANSLRQWLEAARSGVLEFHSDIPGNRSEHQALWDAAVRAAESALEIRNPAR